MIDTRNKRASLIGLGLTAQLVLPSPGTELEALPTRQHLAGLYALASSAAVDIPEGRRQLWFEHVPHSLTFEV